MESSLDVELGRLGDNHLRCSLEDDIVIGGNLLCGGTSPVLL